MMAPDGMDRPLVTGGGDWRKTWELIRLGRFSEVPGGVVRLIKSIGFIEAAPFRAVLLSVVDWTWEGVRRCFVR
jgi:hypothetical protein